MDKTDNSAPPSPPKRRSFFHQESERAVWTYRWFHWALGAALLLLICSFALPPVVKLLQLAEPILVPVLVGLVLAYIFNPLVSLCERNCRMPRPVTAGSIIVLGFMGMLAVMVFVVPTVITQAMEMSHGLPAQLDKLAQYIDGHHHLRIHDTEELKRWLTDLAERIRNGEISLSDYTDKAGMALGAGWSLVAGMLGFAAYLMVAAIVAALCFFFFSWHFPAIVVWPKPFIPIEHQQEVLRVSTLCNQAISAFIRGRLIQALVFGTLLTIGWGVCSVPYWLLLGVLGGVLALLPYLSIAALLPAIGMVLFQQLGTGDEIDWRPVALALGVYMVAYGVDAAIIEPLVQGKATGLSPLAVLLAVLFGGAIAGVLGVMLAIPAAACLLIVWREVLLPRLKTLAGEPE